MATTYNIRGQVRSLITNEGVSNVTVELFKHGGTSLNLTTATNPDGTFQFIIGTGSLNEAEFPTGNIEISFQVSDAINGTLLLNAEDSFIWTPTYQDIVSLAVDKESGKIYQFAGQVAFSNGVPAQDYSVKIYKQEFRERELIATTTLDINGFYKENLTSEELDIVAEDRVGITIDVETAGSIVVATSDVQTLKEVIKVDFTLETTSETQAVFENLLDRIDAVINGAVIADVTDSEIEHLAVQTGKQPGEVAAVVKAYQYSDAIQAATPAGRALMYALIDKNGGGDYAYLSVTQTKIEAIVEEAVNNGIIPDYSADIPGFVTAVKAAQVQNLKATIVDNESFSFNDVLSEVFASQTEIDNFLSSYNDSRDAENPVAFWENLSSGEKKGLQLIKLAGSQPAVVSLLAAEVQSDQGIHKLAEKDANFWLTTVNTACVNSGTVCIPFSIRSKYDLENPAEVDLAKQEYANSLKTVSQELYPLVTIKSKLGGVTGAELIANESSRNDAITFLTNNPDFDLRNNKTDDINANDFDLTGVADVETMKEELLPFQRLFNVTGGSPEAVAAFKADGLSSANDIAAMSEESFIENYSSLLGGEDAAGNMFNRAMTISTITEQATMNLKTYLKDEELAVLGGTDPQAMFSAMQASNPDLVTLFGNMDYCTCQHCLSLYSPAAYFTDLLNLLKNKVPSPLYDELLRRRGDLKYIDLSCKNTNTPLPYIDLVNEILENYILKRENKPVPNSYQTNGTAAELAAHPEHVVVEIIGNEKKYTDNTEHYHVYDEVLKNAVYPEALPFSLALEETRTYLQHLGISRYELMKLFKPVNSANSDDDFSIYSEYFGLSFNEASIIASKAPFNSDPWKYYGLSASTTNSSQALIDPADSTALVYGVWTTVLCDRLDVLINQLNISYKNLLQLLTTDFLNKDNKISIILNDIGLNEGADEATCNLEYLKLSFDTVTKEEFLGKLYRFVRLWRASGLAIHQLDTIMSRQLNITILDDSDFMLLGRVLSFAKSLGIRPEELAMWWSAVDTRRYTDYNSSDLNEIPSVYDKVFRNKAVINVPINQFNDPAALSQYNYDGNTPLIAAFCRMKETEVLNALDFLGISSSQLATPIDIKVLSRIYVIGLLAPALNLSVDALLSVLKILNVITGVDLVNNHDINADDDAFTYLETIAETCDQVRTSNFSLEEIQYLIEDKGDREVHGINNKNIQLFYESLRSELQKFPLDANNNTGYSDETTQLLKNVIFEHFAKQFKVPSTVVKELVEDIQVSKYQPSNESMDLLDALLDPVFIASEFVVLPDPPKSALSLANLSVLEASRPNATLPNFILTELYQAYYLVSKITFVTSRIKIKDAEFGYLYNNPLVINFDMSALPCNGPNPALTKTLFEGILRLSHWFNVKSALGFTDDDFVAILAAASTAPTAGKTIESLKADWIGVIEKNTKWGAVLTDLIGINTAVSNGGLLKVNFNADFVPSNIRSVKLVLTLGRVAGWCRIIGLSAPVISNVLLPSLSLSDSRKILLAAKGKHSNEAWLKIAKPLRDVLRKKQRDALVAYVISHPDVNTANDKKIWRNENELYAFFLIDVEMDPCMMTSRIKQAISSIQLFVDRVLLGVEYKNYDVQQQLKLTGSPLKQWEQWRKWYRVWEANRKVFLYPENWIEPDLRIGKSHFFEELEADLKKDDFSETLAEEAFRGYLNKLAEVARLEPIGAFREYLDGDDNSHLGWWGARPYVLHTFARTYSKPHSYFYRRFEEGEWTPWEKVDIDIASDHIMPYIYNGRLCLYWLTFQKKKGKIEWNHYNKEPLQNAFFYNNSQGNGGENVKDGDLTQDIMEITLNWSEYKNGKWLKQKVGSDKMTLKLNPWLDSDINWKMNHQSRGVLGKKNELTPYEIVKTQLHMSGAILQPHNRLYITLTFPHELQGGGNQWNYTAYDKMRYLHSFRFFDSFSEPEVLRSDVLKSNFQTPYETSPQDNKFISKNANSLRVHHTKHYPNTNQYVYISNFLWAQMPIDVLWDAHYIIKSSKYKVTSIANFINDVFWLNTFGVSISGFTPENWTSNNPLTWDFFFEDETNTFFATNIWKEVGVPVGGGMMAIKYQPRYLFTTFYHPYVKDFVRKLNSGGVESFLNLSTQFQGDSINFQGNYLPSSTYVYNPNPPSEPPYVNGDVDFSYSGSYSCYNWELFFHVPLLIAQRLADNQKFEEARKWYHYIFDPTSIADKDGNPTSSKERFWRFKPFYKAAKDVKTLSQLLDEINKGVQEATAQVEKWQNNPFDPHAIARYRTVAYMKNVVMKYLDNLIAWADKLFKQDTVESINEATQLYILAANILGKRPEEIPARAKVSSKSFSEIENSLDAFSNAKVAVEKYLGPNKAINVKYGTIKLFGWLVIKYKYSVPPPNIFYFCQPSNEKLLSYWDTVADRLFKIRNCMSITGQVRQLPLFEPPIDPGLLVKAAAAGIDTAGILDSLGSAPSNYKFSYVIQKANELCNDVKSLGGALLSALEKKDAETLSLIRSTHELSLLEKIKQLKEIQIQEAEANIASLTKSKETIQARHQYYSTRPFMNDKEKEAMRFTERGLVLQGIASDISSLGSILAIIPQFHLQGPAALGPSFGGSNVASAMQALSTKIGMGATISNVKSGMASTMGGYIRRQDDWNFQTQSALKEIEQIDKQILASQIRKSMTEKELENHLLQMENALKVDEYMRSKFTNEELYSWMISQISTTYFQSYQLAYDMAKTAEKCFNFELPFTKKAKAGYIKFGYWDSLKKGLLAGEKLQHDLRKLEVAYMEGNSRDSELTKHVSLLMLNPEKLIELRDAGTCQMQIPEWLYDLDYPGHYHRRIKSVSVTIPCIAGPYTSIACQLSLDNHVVYQDDGQVFTLPSSVPFKEIATSSAQNDNGMFELNFKDERYIPFEGAGAESSWTLTLMDKTQLRQFDFNTISDVIFHIKYTAQGNGFSGTKANNTKTELISILNGEFDTDSQTIGIQPLLLPRYFSMKHEFSSEFYAGFQSVEPVTDNPPVGNPPQTYPVGRPINIRFKHQHFPYYCKGKAIHVSKIHFYIKSAAAIDKYGVAIDEIDIDNPGSILEFTKTPYPLNNSIFKYYNLYPANATDGIVIPADGEKEVPMKLYKLTGSPLTPGIVNESDIDDIFMVCEYYVGE